MLIDSSVNDFWFCESSTSWKTEKSEIPITTYKTTQDDVFKCY